MKTLKNIDILSKNCEELEERYVTMVSQASSDSKSSHTLLKQLKYADF